MSGTVAYKRSVEVKRMIGILFLGFCRVKLEVSRTQMD